MTKNKLTFIKTVTISKHAETTEFTDNKDTI